MKKTNYLICFLFFVILFCICFTGCNKNEVQQSNTDEISETNQLNTNDKDSEAEQSNSEKTNTENLEIDLADSESYFTIDPFEIEMDGKKLTLPFKWVEIEDTVYNFLSDPPEEIEYSDYFGYFWHSRNGKNAHVYVEIYNPDYSSPIGLNEAKVFNIYMHSIFDEEDYVDIVLPKGITFGASPEEVIKAYGKPYDVSAWGDEIKSFDYKTEDEKYTLTIDFDDNRMSGFNVEFDYYHFDE